MVTISIRFDDMSKAVIPLGYVGENKHRRVLIDCKKMFEDYPTALPVLAVTPPKGETYPGTVTREGDTVMWDITDSDVLYAGNGMVQLSFTVDDIVAKSAICKTRISVSNSPTGSVPTGIEDWLIRAEQLLTDIPEEIDAAIEEAKASGLFDGVGISSIGYVGTVGKVNTYRVNLTDGSNYDFTVENGDDGVGITSIVKTGTAGLVDTYTITLTNNQTYTFTVTNGENGVQIDDVTPAANKTFSSTKVDNELTQVKSAIQVLEPAASASDVGKYLKVKVVSNGKVTEYEFGEGGSGSFDVTILAPQFVESQAYDENTLVTHTDDKLYLLPYGHTANQTWENTPHGTTSVYEYVLYVVIPLINGKANKTHTILETTLSRGRKANTTIGTASVAFGTDVEASQPNAQAFGLNTKASGNQAHAEGSYSSATGVNAHAEGYYSSATGVNAHTEGDSSTAAGNASHAEGSSNSAYGDKSHSEGTATKADGQSAHSEGEGTHAAGKASHSEGSGTVAVGEYGHAEGGGSYANAKGSHAEGTSNTADGASSHVEGTMNYACGFASHVFGKFCYADPAVYNVAEWAANTPYSVDDRVTVTKTITYPSGIQRTVISYYICKTAHTSGSTFSDTNWLPDPMTFVEIAGNGTANSRSNARTLDWDGNERLKGDLYVHANADGTGGKKAAKEEDVNILYDDVLDVQVIPSRNLNKTQYPASVTDHGVTITKNSDGSLSLSGQATGSFEYNPGQEDGEQRFLLPAGDYVISGGISADLKVEILFYSSKTATTARNVIRETNPHTFTLEADAWVCIGITIYDTTNDLTGNTFYPQLEAGTTATEYQDPAEITYKSRKIEEKYTKPQAGIPASDLESGVLVVEETVSGSTPSITGVANHRYICGECSTLAITAPASGIIDVLFESGSTATVLTVDSGIKWANGFDPTSLETNTTYELNILNGEYGVMAAWT